MNALAQLEQPPVSFNDTKHSGTPPEFHVYLRPQATLLRVQDTCWHPPTDVFESDEAYYVKIEMGGMRREELDVAVENHILRISGKREERSPSAKIRYRQAEIKYGPFEIKLKLPRDVDQSTIRAAYDNGFFEAVLPKHTSAHPTTKRVKIVLS